jgi:hypothetical protein
MYSYITFRTLAARNFRQIILAESEVIRFTSFY